MDVKHRSQGHVDITTMEALMGSGTRPRPKHGQGVQHQLPMAIIDALRIAGRAGRIESRGAGVLVKIGKIELLRTLGQQVFVLGRKRKGRRWVFNCAAFIA